MGAPGAFQHFGIEGAAIVQLQAIKSPCSAPHSIRAQVQRELEQESAQQLLSLLAPAVEVQRLSVAGCIKADTRLSSFTGGCRIVCSLTEVNIHLKAGEVCAPICC